MASLGGVSHVFANGCQLYLNNFLYLSYGTQWRKNYNEVIKSHKTMFTFLQKLQHLILCDIPCFQKYHHLTNYWGVMDRKLIYI